MSVQDRRKEILYGNGIVGEVNRNNPTPECEVNGTELPGQLNVSDLFVQSVQWSELEYQKFESMSYIQFVGQNSNKFSEVQEISGTYLLQ